MSSGLNIYREAFLSINTTNMCNKKNDDDFDSKMPKNIDEFFEAVNTKQEDKANQQLNEIESMIMKLGVKLKERAETSALLKTKLKNLEKMLQKTFIL